MKARLLTVLALATLMFSPVSSFAGISVSSPGNINGWFYIYYGLGTPLPGKVAYVSVTKPNGYNYTVAQAENVPDYSQVCYVFADIAGWYRFFYEYSFFSQGVGRTVVLYQDYYIQAPQNNIQWGTSSASPSIAAPSQTSTITVSYTNTGGTYWDGNYYLEFKDPWGTPLYYASVAGTSPNVSGSRSTNVTLPNFGGLAVANYQVRGMQYNVQFFGPVLTVPIWVDYPPTTALSVSSGMIGAGQPVTVTSVTSDVYANVINQAIDYIPPGQSSWVSGTSGAGTRWDGSAVASHTLARSIPLTSVGTWQFRARGQDSLGQLSGFQYQNVTVTDSPPMVVTHPASQTIVAGQSVTFTVSATGSTPLSYQWRKNGTNIAGATGASFAVTNAQIGDAANTPGYTVVVTNSVGSATSNPATLAVNLVAPSIVTHPASQSINIGQSVAFSVVASGSAPLSYQWRKNGANIAGATSSTFSISNAQLSDTASPGYSVVVTNAVGSVTSNAATLTVSTVLPIRLALQYWQSGDYPDREIGGHDEYRLGWHAGECHEVGVDTDGDGEDDEWHTECDPEWYGWGWDWVPEYAADGLYGSRWDTSFGTFGPPLSTATGAFDPAQTNRGFLLNPYPRVYNFITFRAWAFAPGGNCNNFQAALYYPAGSLIAAGSFGSGAYWQYQFGDYWAIGNFRIDVSYLNASATPASGTVAYYVAVGATAPSGPTIVSQPAPAAQTVASGTTVSYSVTASGATAYQWKKDGMTLPTATSSMLTLSNVQSFDGGFYSVVVSNTAGAVTSDAVSLTVSAAVPTITSSLVASGTVGTAFSYTITATNNPTSFSATGLPAGLSVNAGTGVITGTPTSTGTCNVGLSASNAGGTGPGSTLVLTISALTPPTITTQPSPQSAALGQTVIFYVGAGGSPPLSYAWRKGGVALANGGSVSGATSTTLTLTNVQTGDAGNYDVVVSNGAGSATANTVALSISTSSQTDTANQNQLNIHHPLLP